jgi:DNA repair exonuclease SbcCD ATPase subunit
MSGYREVIAEARRTWEEAVAAARRSAGAAMALISAPERLARQEEALQETAAAMADLRERVEALEEAMREAAAALVAREEGEQSFRRETQGLREEASALKEDVRELRRLLEEASGRLTELETAFREHLEMEKEFLRQLAEGGASLVGVAMAAVAGSGTSPHVKEEAAKTMEEGHPEEQPAAVEEEGMVVPTPAVGAEGALVSRHAPFVERERWYGEVIQEQEQEGGEEVEPEADARELKRRLEERRRLLAGERQGLRRFLPLP